MLAWSNKYFKNKILLSGLLYFIQSCPFLCSETKNRCLVVFQRLEWLPTNSWVETQSKNKSKLFCLSSVVSIFISTLFNTTKKATHVFNIQLCSLSPLLRFSLFLWQVSSCVLVRLKTWFFFEQHKFGWSKHKLIRNFVGSSTIVMTKSQVRLWCLVFTNGWTKNHD